MAINAYGINAYVYGVRSLCQVLYKDFACIISFNPPNLMCYLEASTDHTRKYFPDLSSLQYFGKYENVSPVQNQTPLGNKYFNMI